jgi:hypothetical protein
MKMDAEALVGLGVILFEGKFPLHQSPRLCHVGRS